MSASVGTADGGHRGPAGHDELVRLALVVRCLWLRQHHVLYVQPTGIHYRIVGEGTM